MGFSFAKYAPFGVSAAESNSQPFHHSRLAEAERQCDKAKVIQLLRRAVPDYEPDSSTLNAIKRS